MIRNLNKSILTNLIAFFILLTGFAFEIELLVIVGIFALLGALTNWLAIHMLFEKVPFLYGSGVILDRFEDFKKAIRSLILEQFFNKEHVEKFFENNQDLTNIEGKIDFNKVFDSLIEAIVNSSLAPFLQMIGGAGALEGLREPIIEKLKNVLADLIKQKTTSGDFSDNLIEKTGKIIDERLKELTPQITKKIIQDIIAKHLGWLVVWGGVFGGLFGVLFNAIN